MFPRTLLHVRQMLISVVSLRLFSVCCSNDAVKCYGSFLFHTADNLSNAQSGSSLSLASAATNEADSINSGGAGSQR